MRHAALKQLGILTTLGLVTTAWAWTPTAVVDDPLIRMPGTQSGDAQLQDPSTCINCHGSSETDAGQGFAWKGSMMGQAARDFMFWAATTVAGQDSLWALGNPNAMDLCERCHFPEGWLAGRSDPTNASAMTGSDFDGVHCDVCHTMMDPFYKTTYGGSREGNDWLNYWDETNASATPSQTAADATYLLDQIVADAISSFNGTPFFMNDEPFSANYTENGGGQMFVAPGPLKRGPFADAQNMHDIAYSRYHKSKYFCGACHDVSNPALANLDFSTATPGDGTTELPSELNSAFSYFHVERTFSEFMLSAYAQPGGASGEGAFAPETFDTSLPNDYVGRCQDCHMADYRGQGARMGMPVLRPDDSTEHPMSGQPSHDMTGGNLFVSHVLASAVPGSPNYDAVNAGLLAQGPTALTLDLNAGLGMDADALLAYVDNAKSLLESAAALENAQYDDETGTLSFRVKNQTGHKLISGFPEGRRMFVNIKVYDDDVLVHEVNPYDATVGTLKGLDTTHAPDSPDLDANEQYVDELVYEANPTSALTGEDKTFHFVLATGRYKDNRIPPKGFDITNAAERLVQPVWHGEDATDYFTAAEYAGGYDDVELPVVPDADRVEINLYYQTTSREYVAFLRDQINGTGDTLSSPTPSGENNAYVIQTDPFFANLKAWGDTVWDLWEHNKNVPGAAPFLMTQATAMADEDEGEGEGEGTPGPGCAAGTAAGGGSVSKLGSLALMGLVAAALTLTGRRREV